MAARGREIISFDLDGVLAAPPLCWNPAINRDLSLTPRRLNSPPRRRICWRDQILTHSWYRLRYVGRRTRPGALAAVRAAAQRGLVIVLTGRSERGRRQTRAWLDREGFGEHVDELIMNGGGLSSARHKERVLAARPVRLHADDDAATAALLARCGVAVALLDWPRNRGLDFPPSVTRYPNMHLLAAAIETLGKDA